MENLISKQWQCGSIMKCLVIQLGRLLTGHKYLRLCNIWQMKKLYGY